MPNTLTIDDSSPLWQYSPQGFANVTSSGWTFSCDVGNGLWRCDEHSAHQTNLDGAKAALSFYGSGITLLGNATRGMTFTLTVDGKEVGATPQVQTLAQVQNLSLGMHSVSIETKGSTTQSLFTLDAAIVEFPSEEDPESTFYDNRNNSIIDTGSWAAYPHYPSTTVPPGCGDDFATTIDHGATAYLRFSGSAIFVYGPCYEYRGEFTATIDATANTQPQIFSGYIPGTLVIENCLQYYAAGLDPDVSHEFLATNVDQNKTLAIDYIEVWKNALKNSSSSNSTSTAGPNTHTSRAVIAGVTVAFLIAAVLDAVLPSTRKGWNH